MTPGHPELGLVLQESSIALLVKLQASTTPTQDEATAAAIAMSAPLTAVAITAVHIPVPTQEVDIPAVHIPAPTREVVAATPVVRVQPEADIPVVLSVVLAAAADTQAAVEPPTFPRLRQPPQLLHHPPRVDTVSNRHAAMRSSSGLK